MYHLTRVKKGDFGSLCQAAEILNQCGKDMVKRYDLHHWDNPYIKSLLIVLLSARKNTVFLLYDGDRPVATFQIRKDGESMHFSKLAVRPSESGRGAGSYCMKMIEKFAAKQGCKKVAMEVYEPSSHAISFYQNRGYDVVGKSNTLKYQEVIMEKRI